MINDVYVLIICLNLYNWEVNFREELRRFFIEWQVSFGKMAECPE